MKVVGCGWLAALLWLAACSSDSGDPKNPSTTPAPDSGTTAVPDSGTSETPDSGTSGAPDAGKASLAEATTGELKVELLTDTKLETGMTPVYIRITTAAEETVTDATVTFSPFMQMATGKSHSCPVIGTPTLDADNFYRVDVVFQMASTEVDVWTATVDVTRPGATTLQASFPLLTVTDSGRAKVFTYTDPATSATTRYVSSLNFVNPPAVGLNPIVFTLHTPNPDMMSFPAVEDAAMVLDPQMPAMGHGSTGSVDPTPTSLGRYAGQLSFSMTGTWETTVTVSRAGVTLGAPVFTTTF